MFFAFYSLINKVKFSEKRFFAAVAAASLLIATNLPLVKYLYLLPIPVISTTVATRELSLFIFSLIVLGSIGLDHFLGQKEFRKIVAVFYLGGYLFCWALVLIIGRFIPSLAQNLRVAEHNMILPSIIIIVLIVVLFIKRINRKVLFILITILVIFDLFYFFSKITPFAPRSFYLPRDVNN